MSEPTTTMRDALEAAFEEADKPLPASEPVAAIEPDIPAAASDAAEPQAQDASQDLNALAEDKSKDDRPRDENGKFKPKEATEPPAQEPQDQGMQPGPKAGPKNHPERAPQAWRPEVREHWAQLPEPVRAEIARRESEHARFIQDSSEARRNNEALMRTIAPYEAFIRAENSNPMQAIDNLMSTAARLRTGTAPELAQMVAGLVNQFGVGRFGNAFIEQLDSALAGQAPQQDPQQAAIEQALNQRLAPVQQMLTQFQQAQLAQQQQVTSSAQNEVADFLNKAEFGEDVRDDMADLMEAATRRGQNLSLADAYKKACLMNDNVRSVITQRVRAQGAQQGTQAAQKARSTAVQVSGAAPMGALRQDPTDVRSAIEAAIAASSR
ncbi:hypothetical protein UFOVP312_37 [uncultured Caudovirales phage]|uniref:Uncharacterized protein n=1 Tax=uncultured Caudovirales phage TaxID=2100421 RepID=A0A6J5LQ62_9CAUD|nr:hypothetical protein UFOVP312_37 [uncultured Caudovirales phage]